MRGMRYGAIGVAIGLLLGGAGLAWAQGAGNTHENKPFEGTSEGTSTVGTPTDDGVPSTSEGEFWALHLGRGTYAGEFLQDYAGHPDPQCAFVSGELVLTAADGDELWLETRLPGEGGAPLAEGRSVTCAPADQPPSGPAPGHIYTSTLYFDVVGGTGKFTEAAGWVFSRGTSTIGAPIVDVAIMLGDIDY